MSYDINGVGAGWGSSAAAGVNPTSGSGSASPAASASSSAVDATDDAVEVETMPSTPPPEVMDAITVAADAWGRLQTSGQQLRFGVDADTGRVTAELQDLNGNHVSSISPSTVLAIAGGQTP